MFTASTNTLTMLDMDEGAYDYGAATSISPNGLYIAGWAYHTSSSKMKAVVWEAPNYQIDATLSPSTDSYWNAINDSGVPVGAYWVCDHYESVVGDDQNPAYPYSGKEGEAKGINASGRVVGWYVPSSYSHAYRWDSPTAYMDLHPAQGYENRESGANGINNTLNIGGWLTNQYGSHIATHWRPLSVPGMYQTTILGDGDSSSYEVVAINSGSAMLINRVDSVPGIALWINNSLANEAVEIDGPYGVENGAHRILMPNPDDEIYNGFCLNDDLWIGGSYVIHGEGLPRPSLAIPYDVDNSGIADFREIVESGMSGSFSHHNENYGLTWLLDVAENVHPNGDGMRVGLNSPGYSDMYTDDIAYTQIVRLPLGAHNPDFASADDEDFYVNGILDTSGQSQCSDFQTGINRWAQISEGEGREIVLMLRSNLDDTDPDHDYLPTAPNVDLGEGVTKQNLLTNLHWFGYKFARCVDWIQLGNESYSSSDQSSIYGGHGGFKIWAEEIDDCWTGADPREFEDIPVSSCLPQALTAVQAWHHEQMWSILEGSALAGRPLRIIGPAIPMDTIIDCVSEDSTMGWNAIDRTAAWCNDYQAWFDMHARYLVKQDVDAARYYLQESGGDPQWTMPDFYRLVCLEWAPKLEDSTEWWTGGGSARFNKFLNMPDCNDPPGITWETYISGWRNAQFPSDADFGMTTVAGYFDAKNFTVICFGSTLQLPESDPLYDLAALRAQNVCDSYITTQYKFTELKGHYQGAADEYLIEDFDPHPDACSACGGN